MIVVIAVRGSYEKNYKSQKSVRHEGGECNIQGEKSVTAEKRAGSLKRSVCSLEEKFSSD